jgi:hypothetical protein
LICCFHQNLTANQRQIRALQPDKPKKQEKAPFRKETGALFFSRKIYFNFTLPLLSVFVSFDNIKPTKGERYEFLEFPPNWLIRAYSTTFASGLDLEQYCQRANDTH